MDSDHAMNVDTQGDNVNATSLKFSLPGNAIADILGIIRASNYLPNLKSKIQVSSNSSGSNNFIWTFSSKEKSSISFLTPILFYHHYFSPVQSNDFETLSLSVDSRIFYTLNNIYEIDGTSSNIEFTFDNDSNQLNQLLIQSKTIRAKIPAQTLNQDPGQQEYSFYQEREYVPITVGLEFIQAIPTLISLSESYANKNGNSTVGCILERNRIIYSDTFRVYQKFLENSIDINTERGAIFLPDSLLSFILFLNKSYGLDTISFRISPDSSYFEYVNKNPEFKLFVVNSNASSHSIFSRMPTNDDLDKISPSQLDEFKLFSSSQENILFYLNKIGGYIDKTNGWNFIEFSKNVDNGLLDISYNQSIGANVTLSTHLEIQNSTFDKCYLSYTYLNSFLKTGLSQNYTFYDDKNKKGILIVGDENEVFILAKLIKNN